jgi:LysR family glycine cleavage system transcriptional activator
VGLAAEELGVSQSAVSHQIRELTRVLGENLIVRSGRGISLSPTGKRLADRLGATFSGLQSSLDEIVGDSRELLRLAVCSSFGPGWLIPRLREFIETNPGINLQLLLYAQDPDLTNQVADAIVSAIPVEQGYSAIRLIEERLVAVEAPGQPHGKKRLITTDIDPRKLGQDWVRYCAEAGLPRDELQDGAMLQCSHYLLALEMARAGLGVALVPEFLAKRDIDSGSLAYFNQTRVPSGRTYNISTKQSRANEPAIATLVYWLRSQLA